MTSKEILNKLKAGDLTLKDVSDIHIVIIRCVGDPEIPENPAISPELYEDLLKTVSDKYSLPSPLTFYDYESHSLKPLDRFHDRFHD